MSEHFLFCLKVDERTGTVSKMLINKHHIVAAMPYWNIGKAWTQLWLTDDREMVISMDFEKTEKELNPMPRPRVRILDPEPAGGAA